MKLPIVALMGVDGSGKSTAIERLEAEFTHPSVKKIQVYAYRQIPRQRYAGSSAGTDNHQDPTRSFLFSFFKLTFRAIRWYWEYYRISKLRSKGSLIILDRFYFLDIQVDPLKYRYSGPASFLSTLIKMVPKPDMYILLDAPESITFARKQEVIFEEVTRQRNVYLNLFKTLPNASVVDASQEVDKVVEDAAEIILKNIPFPSAI